MTEVFNFISTAPSFLQIIFVVLFMIGLYAVYKFRVIVGLISAAAIAIYVAIKKDKK